MGKLQNKKKLRQHLNIRETSSKLEARVINGGDEIKNLRQRVLQKEHNGRNVSKYERSKSDYSGKTFQCRLLQKPFSAFPHLQHLQRKKGSDMTNCRCDEVCRRPVFHLFTIWNIFSCKRTNEQPKFSGMRSVHLCKIILCKREREKQPT